MDHPYKFQFEYEEEEIDTASTEELARIANKNGKNPLDYDYDKSKLQSPTEILENIDKVESISVDQEVMQFIVNYSVNKLWKRMIAAYEDKEDITQILNQIVRNGNYYHDEVVNQFLTDYNGTVHIMNNLPAGYSSNTNLR